jgi:uncharacterized protein
MEPRSTAHSQPNWRAILLFYALACTFSWPFFWWRDIHTQSWNASPIPPEIRDLTWGPAVAAYIVGSIYPQARSKTISLLGSSASRSILCFVIPILLAWIAVTVEHHRFENKLVYYLLIGGVSTFGEEKGWRGFLQEQLQPLGIARGYLLLAAMWEAWHFTSHFKGSWHDIGMRLCWLLPLVLALTFLLGFLTARTGSLLLAVTVHEWVDIIADPGDRALFWSGVACIPIVAWIVWRWPKRVALSSQADTRNVPPFTTL